MIELAAERVAAAAGGTLLAGDPGRSGPNRAVIDSRAVEPGDLFVGLPGTSADGSDFAPAALEAGASGYLQKSAADRELVDALIHCNRTLGSTTPYKMSARIFMRIKNAAENNTEPITTG